MGFSRIIPMGIIFIPLLTMAMTVPGITSMLFDINSSALDVSALEDSILDTHFQILNLQTTGLNNKVFFDISNTGDTKLWDYDNFDVILTYEGIVNSAAKNVTETLHYSTVAPSDDPILFDKTTTFTGSCVLVFGCQFSHDVTPLHSDRILIVAISKQEASSINSVSYGGQALTKIREDDSGNAAARTSLWYLVNPPTGTNTVDIRGLGLLTINIVVGATSFTGVDQTTPIDAQNGATGNSATPATSVTTTTNEAWIIDVVGTNGGTISVGSGQVERWNALQSSTRGSGSTEFTSLAGTFQMSWTKSAASNWAISAAALRPAHVGCCVVVGGWTISNISGDYYDPGIINKDEIASVAAKTSYQIVTNGGMYATVVSDNGVKVSSFTTAQ